jgi:hypothetical protein
MRWPCEREVGFLFLEDVEQAGWDGDAARYREGKAMRLAWPVIGILSQNHRANLRQGCVRKCGKPRSGGGKDLLSRRFLGAEKTV